VAARTTALEDGIRLAIMRALEERPEVSQRELARELGLSLGKTNYCLRALIEKGWVKARNFRDSGNKLAYAYVLTPSGLRAKASATLDFLARKQSEFVALEAEIERLRLEVDRASRSARNTPGQRV
jgi:EPS-associated MarR family transcriptional regulator